MRSKFASAAVCVAAFSGAAAAAQPVPETVVTGEAQPALRYGEERVSAVVRYGDLDLGSTAGVEALHGRVYRAATRICIEPGLQPLDWRRAGLACRDGAIAGAQEQIALAIADRDNPNRLASASLVIRAAR